MTGEPLGGAELRSRAVGGVLLLGARGIATLAVGVGANIVLARLLAPRDYGLVALGTVLVVVAGYLAESGLGAALIRGPEPPTRRQLEAVNGLQVLVTLVVAAAIAAASIPFGRDGLVVAAMVVALPIVILKSPAMIALERNLEYRQIATVDLVEALVFYAWAVPTVAAGLGVWGMASGMVLRSVAGTALMAKLAPVGLVRPRWDWPTVRPLLRFGLKMQAAAGVGLLREQGLNLAVAVVSGVAALGVWNLAWRVLRVPATLFMALGRVAYPGMSRLLAAGEDPRPVIERAVASVAVATAIVLVGMVGFAPALPALVGAEWGDVPETLLWSAAALMLAAPTTIVATGYLYASDAAGLVAGILLAQVAVWFAVGLPLLPELGVPSVGIGWVAGAVVSAVLFARAARRRSGARLARNAAVPTALAVLAGALGWWIATLTGERVPGGTAGAAVAEIVLIGGLALSRGALLRETWVLLLRSARTSTAAPEATVETGASVPGAAAG